MGRKFVVASQRSLKAAFRFCKNVSILLLRWFLDSSAYFWLSELIDCLVDWLIVRLIDWLIDHDVSLLLPETCLDDSVEFSFSFCSEEDSWEPNSGVGHLDVVKKTIRALQEQESKEEESTAPVNTYTSTRCLRMWKFPWFIRNIFNREFRIILPHFIFIFTIFVSAQTEEAVKFPSRTSSAFAEIPDHVGYA